MALPFLTRCGREKEPAIVEIPQYAQSDYAAPAPTADIPAVTFALAGAEAGIDFVHVTGAAGDKWMPETMGSGGGFVDYDGNGHLDIFLVNGCEWTDRDHAQGGATPALYRNLGDGRFENVTEAAGLAVTCYGMGAAFGDYDGDGDPDLYLTALGSNRLYRNDGGRFTDVTAEAGVDGNPPGEDAIPSWSMGAAWLDGDRDGDLDLLVTNYVQWTPETDLYTTIDGQTKSYATPQQYQGQSCRYYVNNGDGTFRDATADSGLETPGGKSLGITLADLNDDGWIDVAIANDTEPNFLYVNNGDGTFTDIALTAGVAYDEAGRARAGMGIDAGDLHNDGRQAIAIGNFAREPLSLFTQVDTEFFQDMAGRARLTRPTLLSLTFGVLFADFDLNGYLDIVMANGHIEPEINTVQRDVTFEQAPQLFLNTGEGSFAEATARAGKAFAEPIVARGLATADVDRDGDVDLLVTVNGGPARLFLNQHNPGAAGWIAFRLEGAGRNTAALGARVRVRNGDQTQQRLVRTGSSYLTQSDTAVHFGLAGGNTVEEVEIRWPMGRIDTFGPLTGGREYVISEETRQVSLAPGLTGM